MVRYDRRTQALAVCLSALAGFVDAVAFINLGGFFVSFMRIANRPSTMKKSRKWRNPYATFRPVNPMLFLWAAKSQERLQ